MNPADSAFLQYGALGILAVVLVIGLKFLGKLLDKFITSLDKLDATMCRLCETVTTEAKNTRHDIAGQIQSLTIAVLKDQIRRPDDE